jgi:uncharacterized membrane protein YfcA
MIVLAVVAGILAGFISSWGIGGGTLLMIYLSCFAGLSQTAAQGINLLYFLPASLSALYSHLKGRLVDFSAAVPAVSAGVFSALLTALVATSLDVTLLKKIFGVFLICVGFIELIGKPDGKSESKDKKQRNSSK